MPQTPLLLLQHRREATRKLNSGALLQLAVSPTRLATVVARSIHSARQSSAWARYVEGEGRTPLLLYPCASALSVADVRERMRAGRDYFLIAIDGTWTEAKEILFSHSSINAEKDMVLPECLALTPADLAGHPGPLFAGCRKPRGPSSLCTLEAVALALGALESGAAGASLTSALLRPMLRMVGHQIALTAGREVHRTERPGYMLGLTETAAKAAAAACAPSSIVHEPYQYS